MEDPVQDRGSGDLRFRQTLPAGDPVGQHRAVQRSIQCLCPDLQRVFRPVRQRETGDLQKDPPGGSLLFQAEEHPEKEQGDQVCVHRGEGKRELFRLSLLRFRDQGIQQGKQSFFAKNGVVPLNFSHFMI